jgi:NADH-quinone oxidoreductase subunit J
MELVLFGALAALSIGAALVVVLHPDAVYSALGLIGVMCLLAALFVTLDAHVIAAFQIIVYAGAVMVLYLFVIMLLGGALETGARGARPGLWVAGGLGAAVVGVALVGVVAGHGGAAGTPAPPPEGFGSVERLATELFTTYLLPFELTSILLLIAVVGAVVLAKERFGPRRADTRRSGGAPAA